MIAPTTMPAAIGQDRSLLHGDGRERGHRFGRLRLDHVLRLGRMLGIRGVTQIGLMIVRRMRIDVTGPLR